MGNRRFKHAQAMLCGSEGILMKVVGYRRVVDAKVLESVLTDFERAKTLEQQALDGDNEAKEEFIKLMKNFDKRCWAILCSKPKSTEEAQPGA